MVEEEECLYCCRAVCNCARDEQYVDTIKRIAREYSEATEQLISTGRYDTKDDFTAVFQPFMKKNDVPRKVSCSSGVCLCRP